MKEKEWSVNGNLLRFQREMLFTSGVSQEADYGGITLRFKKRKVRAHMRFFAAVVRRYPELKGKELCVNHALRIIMIKKPPKKEE